MDEISVPDYYGAIIDYSDSLSMDETPIALDVPDIEVSRPVAVKWSNFFKDFGLIGITAAVAAIVFLLNNSGNVSSFSRSQKSLNKTVDEYQKLVKRSNDGRSPTAHEIKRMRDLEAQIVDLRNGRDDALETFKDTLIDKAIANRFDPLLKAADRIETDSGASIVIELSRLNNRINSMKLTLKEDSINAIDNLLRYLTLEIAKSNAISQSNQFKASNLISAIRSKLKEVTSVSI